MSGAIKDAILVADRTRPLATTVVALPVGGLHDPPGKEGLAYLTGQMLTRGAGGLSQAQLADELDYLGASLGLSTGRETTSLSGDSLTRSFDAYEALAAAIINEPTFAADELDKLKRQTLAELAQLRDSDAALGQRFFVRSLFEGHPYGRPLKGTPTSIATITRDDVVGFYRAHYRAANVLAGAAGDLTADRFGAFLERTAARLPADPIAEPTVPEPRPPGDIRVLIVDKPERSQTQVFMGHPTVDANHPDFLPLRVAHTLFGGTFTARLSHEIREKRGWSYGAYSYLNADRHLGTFTMRFYPATADAAPAIALAADLFTELVADGAPEDQVAFAKRYLINSHPFSIDTAEKRLHERLMRRLTRRPADWLERYTERLGAITAEQVTAAMARHLTPAQMLVVVVATADDVRPALEAWDLAAAVDVIDYMTEA